MESPASTLVFENQIPEKRLTSVPSSAHAKQFRISTLGVPVLRLPFPGPSQLVTTVSASDGSVTYTSTRGKRNSGNCVLASPGRGDLISTTYHVGPGRPPRLRYVAPPAHADGGGEIQLQGKWWSHAQSFRGLAGDVLEWRYGKEPWGDGADKKSVLALVEGSGGRTIARLVRTDETRTEGSKKCSAGNGGLLIIEEGVAAEVVDEALIIATCLVMLKKEVDRRRMLQGMVLSAAISGGTT